MHVEPRIAQRVLRLIASVAFGLVILSVNSAQAQLLDLEIKRPLTAEETELLSEILIQNPIEETVRSSVDQARPVGEICTLVGCEELALEQLREASEAANQTTSSDFSELGVGDTIAPNGDWEGGVLLPGSVTRDGENYLVVDPASRSGLPFEGTGPVAIPLGGSDNALAGSAAGTNYLDFEEEGMVVEESMPPGPDYPESVSIEAQAWPEWSELEVGALVKEGDDSRLMPVLSATSQPGQIIDADIARTGQSLRTFEARDLPKDQLAALLTSLNEGGGVQARVRSEDEAPPVWLDVAQSVVAFEGAETRCRSVQTDGGWPYDVDEVVKILQFNASIMTDLGIPISRALVLIVDTGIGSSLVENELRKSLAPNVDELLHPSTEFTAPNQDPSACIDRDLNGYYDDVYGASSAYSKTTDEGKCGISAVPGDPRAVNDPRILTIPRREGSVETGYDPGHGSVVSVLATGGPELLELYPDIRQNIGLRFFRVTRPPITNTNTSVRVDKQDMLNAIDYAKKEGADVVNFSMKSDDDPELRTLFVDNHLEDVLVVASAGNQGESLDTDGGRKIPASLESSNLVVVGGLLDDIDRSWWPKSGRGQRVNVAVPSVNIPSLNENGTAVCVEGTSAAAPTVTFIAGVLASYDFGTADKIKRRIVNSADLDEAGLTGRVKNFKRLNVASALDVFVDRVTLIDPPEVIRGRIVTRDRRLIRVCGGASMASNDVPLAGEQGWKDPYHLQSWHRLGERIVFEVYDERETLKQCGVPPPVQASLEFFEIGKDAPEPIMFSNIASIIFSSYRSREVEDTVLFDEIPITSTRRVPRSVR